MKLITSYSVTILFLLLSATAIASDSMGILETCRPDPSFYSDTVRNATSRESLMESYSGIDFPDQAEWAACEIAANLKSAKSAKIEAIKLYGVSLAQVYYPAITDFEMLRLLRDVLLSIVPAARDLQPGVQAIDNIWQSGEDAVISVNTLSTLAEIEAYDPVNDPAWP